MRVLFDNQCFDMQKWGGISMYHAQLLANLPQHGVSPLLGVQGTENEHLGALMPKLREAKSGRKIPYDRSIADRLYRAFGDYRVVPRRLRNKYYSFDLLRDAKFDIFHPTYYDLSFLRYLKTPFVLTLHDFTPELFPDLLLRQENLIEAKRELSTRAKRIIAISEATKDDAIRFLGLDEQIIDVIHHGYCPTIGSQPGGKVSGLPEQYLLFVGGRTGYKNFDFLVSSFSRIAVKHPDLHILCTGKPFSAEEATRLESLGMTEKVLHRSFSDQELPFVYSEAVAFVFPSLYEGFGLPILEAFSACCPVLLSDIPVFHEIAGGAADYFDPRDEESLAATLNAILGNRKPRTEYITKGRERLGHFSWADTALETKASYERALA